MLYTRKGLATSYRDAVNVEDCTSAREAIIKAKMNFMVEKRPIYIQSDNSSDFNIVENNYATVRADNEYALGIVKDKYEVVQNDEVFSFFDYAVTNCNATYHTAGAVNGGSIVFLTAKLPTITDISSNDSVDNYLVFVTSHDGSMSVRIILTPVRVICLNTLSSAIANSRFSFAFKHTQSITDNMKTAQEIIYKSGLLIDKLSLVYSNMFNNTVSDKESEEFFAKSVLTHNEYSKIFTTGHNLDEIYSRNYRATTDAEISSRKINQMIAMNDYYHNGIGQKEIVGTSWGLYNAVSGYYCNVDNIEGSKRMQSLLYGTRAKKIEQAGKLLLTN